MSTHETIYTARKFRLERRTVREPDGAARTYEMIAHPGAAVILPLLGDDRVVLIRTYRFSVGESLLELPAGTLEPGEEPAVCARRELQEETGFTAESISPLVAFYSSPGICNERMHIYVARGLRAGRAAPEPGEHIEIEPMTVQDALAATESGRVRDAKTIVGLLYYRTFGARLNLRDDA